MLSQDSTLLSANSLDKISPQNIVFAMDSADETYIISSVSPTLISNDALVTVSCNSSSPSSTDWIGAYSPANVDITTTVPVKYGYCGNLIYGSDYINSGLGQVVFNMTNLRADIKFYYFIGGTSTPMAVGNSSQIVRFENYNQPLRNRVVATGNPNIYQVLWSGYNSTQPTLRWGTSPNNYIHTFAASNFTIERSQLCGGPANSTGFRDLGVIYTAEFVGIETYGLSNQDIYYVFGDAATTDYSSEITFHVPPLAGTQPADRGTQVVLLADLGIGSTDSSADTVVWVEECPPAINTTMSIGALVANGSVDAIFHSGDVSYANGYLASWDFFLDMISPMAGSALYFTTVGNHESDWPDTASLYNSKSSGGECSVVATSLLPMPVPATTNEPWWSYDIGIIHFVGMSTEHNFSVGSTQYNFLSNDLTTVNRTKTPWIIFSGHRSMYVDSDNCCISADDFYGDDCTVCAPGTDVGVMQQLQLNIEPLLYENRVNLAFSGHFHDMQRQSAVYQNMVVQRAEMITDSDGNHVAYHNNPNATVWMVIGSAGNGPNIANTNYSWSERYWDYTYGYAIVTAVNATYLQWQLINSATNDVIDRMVITQDFTSWDATTTIDGNGVNGSDLSNGDVVIVIVFIISFASLLLALLVRNCLIPRWEQVFPPSRDGHGGHGQSHGHQGHNEMTSLRKAVEQNSV